MKEKKLIAMFITSVVAFVASLTISLGVAFALADPVAAVGLAEISYKVSNSSVVGSQEIVFNPVSSFNGNVSEAVYVNSYEEILYADEMLPENIKLVKVTVQNDTDSVATIDFNITVIGNTNAVNYVKYAIFNVERGSANPNTELLEETIAARSTAHFVVAAYVSDEYAVEMIDYATSMTMNISIDRMNIV